MAKDTPGLDPRFNPAFQRGFSGHAGDEAEIADAPPPAPTPSPPTMPVRNLAPAAAPPRLSPPAALSSPASAVEDAEEDIISFDAHDDGRELEYPGGINPFLVVLGILAVVLVGAGVWVFLQAGAAFDDFANIRSQGDYMALQSLMTGAPMLVILGLATGLGVLFALAARWRRRR